MLFSILDIYNMVDGSAAGEMLRFNQCVWIPMPWLSAAPLLFRLRSTLSCFGCGFAFSGSVVCHRHRQLFCFVLVFCRSRAGLD